MEPTEKVTEIKITDPVPDKKMKNSRDNLTSVVSVALFILLALGVIVFLYNQNQNLKKQLSVYQPIPTQSATPAATTPGISGQPDVSTPSANSKVKSPLKVSGTVPPGWMFEGVFPIRLLDSEQKVIAQGQAKETTEGSWQSGEPVEFTATLTFKNATGTGTLILENDNPSGDPASSRTFEVPIKFTNSVSYTCPGSGWIDCMPGTDPKPGCSTEAINWYKENCPDFKGIAY
jgi:hypothetical protein